MKNFGRYYLLTLLLLCGICMAARPARAQTLKPWLYTNYQNTENGLSLQKGETLAKALKQLEKKFDVAFLYRNDVVEDKKIAKDISLPGDLKKALKKLLKGRNLTFEKFNSKTYGIYLMREVAPKKTLPQSITVQGTVIEAKHHSPLTGVNIAVKGTAKGTSTDSLGHYKLEAPSPSDTLVFSFIGYHQQVVPIQGRSKIDVVMKPEEVIGKNLVVTAYGEKRNKISLVGAVQSIKSPSTTLQIPSSSLTQSFAGRMAGVIAFNRSGQPGKNAAQFFIRGISTFSGSNQPLIIIDGVEGSRADLNTLDPSIIKSFSILKDATATAVYGSRGANGVMIVQTKTGGNFAHPKINIRLEGGASSPAKIPHYANGVEFMKLFNEAVSLGSSGKIPYTQDKIRGTRLGLNKYVYPNVDWYHKLFKKFSFRQKANINVRGGGKRITYFMSGGYNRSTGQLRSANVFSYNNNIRLNRYSFQNNLTYHPLPTTSVSLKLHTYLRNYQTPATSVNNLFSNVLKVNPVDFPVIFPKKRFSDLPGKIIFGGSARGGTAHAWNKNPYATMTNGHNSNFQSTVRANLYLKQNLKYITKGLSFSGLISFKNWSSTTVKRQKGFNNYQITNYKKLPTDSTYNYDYNLEMIGEPHNLSLGTSTGTNGDRTVYLEFRLNYKKEIAENHSISAMALYNQSNFNTNNPGGLISSLPERTRGIAGRINYSYNNTYLAEFDFGYNGSEEFAAGHRYGFFPSYAAGIVLSNEKFWKPIKPIVNFFKVRASYGLVGNHNIGGARFVYQSIINLNSKGYNTGRNQGVFHSGFSVNRFANPAITWEVGHKLNLGLNLRFIHSLSVTVNFYRNNRTNIFLQRNTLPPSLGTSGTTIYGNLGSVLNKGFDVQMNYSKVFNSNLFLAFKGTFTYSHNKVTAKDEPPFLKHPNLHAVGHPVGAHLGYVAEHLFIDKAEIKNSPEQQLGGFVRPGDIKYEDFSGDGIVNGNDRVHMGYPAVPEIEFGFGPSIKYRNWDFSFLLQGVTHTSFFMRDISPFGRRLRRNIMQFIINDHWSPNHPNIYAAYPRLNATINKNNTVNSSWWLRNGSFIKLKSAEIGYTLEDARFYLSGLNLLIFSPFKLWDPEQGGGNGLGYPIQRVFTFGVKFTL